jgi:transcriptional regulator with XRE-family HTH domain
MFYREFGRRLREARRSVGMTQAVLADSVGLSRTSITNIERGKQHIPLHLLPELAAALGDDALGLVPPLANGTLKPMIADLSPSDRAWVRRVVEGSDDVAETPE